MSQNNAVSRAVGAVGLCAIALIHLLDLPDKFEEVPYLGVLYVGLIVASLAAAALLLRAHSRTGWVAAGALSAATVAGFVLTRTTGLPGATEDRGNWGEPLGLASLFVEAAVIALAGYALRSRPAVDRPERSTR